LSTPFLFLNFADDEVGFPNWEQVELKTEALAVFVSPGGANVGPAAAVLGDFSNGVDPVGRAVALAFDHVLVLSALTPG